MAIEEDAADAAAARKTEMGIRAAKKNALPRKITEPQPRLEKAGKGKDKKKGKAKRVTEGKGSAFESEGKKSHEGMRAKPAKVNLEKGKKKGAKGKGRK